MEDIHHLNSLYKCTNACNMSYLNVKDLVQTKTSLD